MTEPPPSLPENALEKADALTRQGKWDEALTAYAAAQEKHPLAAEAGMAYARYGRKRNQPPNLSKPAEQAAQDKEQREKNRNKAMGDFENRATVATAFPTQLTLENTTKCNFFCQTCNKGYGPYYAEDMGRDVLEQVENVLLPYCDTVGITGYGEPLLSRQFDHILELLARNHCSAHLVTNGSLLHFARLEQLLPLPLSVAISMDGACCETFEAIRRGGNFAQILRKLAMIQRLRAIYQKESRARFVLQFVALCQNLAELEAVVELAAQYNLDGIHVVDYEFHNREFDAASPRNAPEWANACLDRAEAKAAKLGIPLELPGRYDNTPPGRKSSGRRSIRSIFPLPNRFAQECHSPWMEPYIRTNGVVTPCCVSAHHLGDLRKTSFEQIWNDRAYRWFRRRLKSPIPPICCRECVAHWGINAGNPGRAKNREGLLVKVWYFLEYRWQAWRDRSGKKPPQPAPNYFQGRPLKKSR